MGQASGSRLVVQAGSASLVSGRRSGIVAHLWSSSLWQAALLHLTFGSAVVKAVVNLVYLS